MVLLVYLAWNGRIRYSMMHGNWGGPYETGRACWIQAEWGMAGEIRR